jgi:hypothetical protein
MRTSLRIVWIALACALIWGYSKRGRIETSATIPPSARCVAPDNMQLDIPLKAQETGAWCWAASAQMVLASPALSVVVAQCDVATKRFGPGSRCCDAAGVPATCVRGGWPPFGQYGYTPTVTKDSALSWDEVKVQIGCRKQAFAFTWHMDNGGDHMMVATGYKTEGANHLVCVNNPLPLGSGQAYCLPYNEYVSGPDHTHGNDYYNLVKKE